MNAAWTVFVKELVDALRDRRTLAVVLLSSVAMGPLVLALLSGLVASLEASAERRVVVAVGLEAAPTLRNYLERQGFRTEPAPPEHEVRLREGQLGDAVLVVEPDFEARLARGEAPVLRVVSDSSHRRAEAGAGRLARLLDGFDRERALLTLALRGVPSEALRSVDVQVTDLASPRGRAAPFTAMLPFFVIMAVLYGALNAALDTTAGERERGSLEPLLTNPAAPWALALGKWAAVAAVAMLIALLGVASLLPARWLIRSETLRALFVFGPAEAAAFLALLLPLATSLSALMMALAIRARTVKEAQASSALLILAVSLAPLVAIVDPAGDRPWYPWVPALAQHALMNRVLRGEPLGAAEVAVPLLVGALLTLLCLADLARRLKGAARG